jgi:hypothetical protein
MPATALPPLVELEGSGSTPNSATFRAGIGNVRRFLAGLLGTTGEVIDAVAALGLNKVSGDCLQTRVAQPSLGPATSNSLITRSTAPVFTPKGTASLLLVKCKVDYTVAGVDTAALQFGIYQDTSLISATFGTQNNLNVVAPAPGSGYAYIEGSIVVHALVSNAALTARNFFLKATGTNSGGGVINRALWEISEYVA